MSTILIRTDLDQDPRVLRVAQETRKPVAFVVGGLVWLWSKAFTQSHGGVIPKLTAQMIDRTTGIKGFCAALVLVQWLVVDPDGVVIPDFEKYHGRSAKTRHQERVKKTMQRYIKCPDPVPVAPGQNRDKNGTEPGQERDRTGTRTGQQRDIGSDLIGSDLIGSDLIGSDPLTSVPAPPPPAEPGAGGGGVCAETPSKPGMPHDWIESGVWRRDVAARAIAAAYPNAKAPGHSGPKVVATWLQNAGMSDPRFTGIWGEAEAAVWLLGRVKAFAASPWVRSTADGSVPMLRTWLDEARYELDDSAWAGSNSRSTPKHARPKLETFAEGRPL